MCYSYCIWYWNDINRISKDCLWLWLKEAKMSMFYLTPDISATDLECPWCHMTFEIEWYTE